MRGEQLLPQLVPTALCDSFQDFGAALRSSFSSHHFGIDPTTGVPSRSESPGKLLVVMSAQLNRSNPSPTLPQTVSTSPTCFSATSRELPLAGGSPVPRAPRCGASSLMSLLLPLPMSVVPCSGCWGCWRPKCKGTVRFRVTSITW
ncbi:unnamed protein product, partial [Trypanosoma congolense IL3000]